MSAAPPPPSPGSSGSAEPDPLAASLDDPHRRRRMQALARGIDLYLQIEDLADDWLDQVCGPDLSRQEALLALASGLRGALLKPPGSGPLRP